MPIEGEITYINDGARQRRQGSGLVLYRTRLYSSASISITRGELLFFTRSSLCTLACHSRSLVFSSSLE
jgi:hypothetical protein